MNTEKIRKDFPLLQKPNPPIYFDSACQSLRPVQVIEAMNDYYRNYPACAGRSMHKLGKQATDAVNAARKKAQKFFSAKHEEEIIFTRNTTEGLNLVARALSLQKGDEVLLSDKEHNSNLIPWQVLAKERGITLKRFSFGNAEDFQKQLTAKTKLASFVHTSNLDGTTNPVKELARIAHDNKTLVMIDGAQAAPHKEIDLRKIDTDFFSCSGHKMLGPSGTGMLYGRKELFESMNPFIVGGETVIDSTYETHIMEPAPAKYEAGLQDYAGIIGLGAALDYLKSAGLPDIEQHEQQLNQKATDALRDTVKIIGPDAGKRSGIFSFNIPGMDFHHIALMLDTAANIAIRSGVHCCHSWFHANGIKGSARASFYLYNTEEECNVFAEQVRKIAKTFAK